MDETYEQTVARHWYSGSPASLMRQIDAGLEATGVDPNAIGVDDLLAVDEFHIRGREATSELAELAGFGSGDHVIDVGSGVGGPSRYLASACGCRVTGVDLTEEYVTVAQELARRVGLGRRVEYRQANAVALPFDDHCFSGAWTQHISMNIPDKRTFFAEMRRVVRPGGTVAIYDPIMGSGEPLTLPVPWARSPETSHLLDAEATRAAIEEVGLTVETWRDVSRESLDWFAARAAAGREPPALGLHLLLGDEWAEMARNMVDNLRQGRIRVVQIIARA